MARAPRPTGLRMREGVSPSCLALPHWPRSGTPPARLLDYLAQRLPKLTRDEWAQRMQQGEVVDALGQPLGPHAPYRGGESVYYWRRLPAEAPIPFAEHIVFQDEWLLVADKPHFLPVTPTGRYVQQSLLVRLKRRTGLDTLVPLHRLDRETAGLVVFCIRPETRNAYQALFREREVRKVYEAVAPWRADLVWPQTRHSRIEPDPQAFYRQIECAGAPNSETHIELLRRLGANGSQEAMLALYRLSPVTGKTHQLRVHMAGLGLPLQGDQFYPVVRHAPDREEDFSQPLQLLARALAFDDPVTGQHRVFQSTRALQATAAENPAGPAAGAFNPLALHRQIADSGNLRCGQDWPRQN